MTSADSGRTADSLVDGFDVSLVDAWLRTVTDVDGAIEWARLPGGHSNLTYELRDVAGREFVIRRPPLGHLPAKAHDMRREYRIVKALWSTAVPVPEPLAYCDDRAIAETHFHLMRKVGGRALHSGAVAASWLDEPARRRAGESFIDALAALHAIEPADIGLADLGRPDGYVERQLRAWYRSWTTTIPLAQWDDPRIHALHELLATSIPEQGPARLVHGDYGPHNSLFDRSGRVLAVLDWELAALGDPLADLAYAINAWMEPGDAPGHPGDPPTALPGFPSRAELVERYAALTGADLANLAYFRVLSSWKTACIVHGVYARYVSGQKSAAGVDLEAVRARGEAAIDAAEALAADLP